MVDEEWSPPLFARHFYKILCDQYWMRWHVVQPTAFYSAEPSTLQRVSSKIGRLLSCSICRVLASVQQRVQTHRIHKTQLSDSLTNYCWSLRGGPCAACVGDTHAMGSSHFMRSLAISQFCNQPKWDTVRHNCTRKHIVPSLITHAPVCFLCSDFFLCN